MASKQDQPLQLRMVESILKTSKTCFDLIRPALNPKRPDPIVLCFAVYVFSRLDLEIVRIKLGEGLRDILYDAFVDGLVKAFRGISRDALQVIVNEELDSLGKIYRTKSGGGAFVEMHNYLEVLLGAASIQKKPTLWRWGKDPLVLIGFSKVMVIRATLSEIEKSVIIPRVKVYLDALAGKDTKKQPEVKGVEAIKRFFRETKEWQTLPQSVTDKIAEKLADEQGQAFIELEKVVMFNDLIEKKFKPICDEYAGTDSILFFLAGALYDLAIEKDERLRATKDLSKEEIRRLLIEIPALWRSAIILQPNFVVAKMRLGYFFRGVGEFDTALKHWHHALVDIENLRGKSGDSFETFGLEEDQAESLKKQVQEAIAEATKAKTESK